MAFRIPGTNIKIGKSKGKSDKKKTLDAAYKRILRANNSDSKVIWPELEEGPEQWYNPATASMRRATASGLMREAEKMVPGGAPNYKLKFDQPDYGKPMLEDGTYPKADFAYSSSAGLVNMPSDIEGYMSKPQYLSAVLAHEVAHNKDWVQNKPAIGHNKETYRPLEKAASRAAMLEPRYNPGDDVGPGGMNEYADEYKSLGPFKPKYWISSDVQDQTRGIRPIDVASLLSEVVAQRKNFQAAGGKTHRGVSNRPARASLT